MSAKSSEEPGLDGKWFEEEYERNGLFGNTTAPRFDEDELHSKSWEDELSAQKPFHHQFESDRKGPSVAMETASTDDPLSGLFLKSSDGEGDLYTSLLSSQTNPFGGGTALFSAEGNRSPPAPHGTDSGIEMTPGDPADLAMTLQGSGKAEAYNYMDITHGEDLRDLGNLQSKQRSPFSSYGDDLQDELQDRRPQKESVASEPDPFDLGRYLEKSPPAAGGSAGGQHAFPYVEDPSEDESEYRSYRMMGTPQTASPAKSTVAAESRAAQLPPRDAPPPTESMLSLGLQGVPTFTLSEPEDESPASSSCHSPTGRESPSDVLFQPGGVKSVSSAQERSSILASSPTKPSSPWDLSGTGLRDQDSSEDESEDSEIEQVADELDSPLPEISSKSSPKGGFGQAGNPFEQTGSAKRDFGNPFDQPHATKGNFGQPGNPFEQPGGAKGSFCPTGNPAPSAPIYSLLREEREAELDSELLIESASEESPKRDQGSPDPKRPEGGTAPSPPAPRLFPSNPAPPPRPPAPAPAEPPASVPKEKPASGVKTKTSPQQEDSWCITPKPAAMATPAACVEQPPLQDWGEKSRSGSEGRADPERAAAAPLILLQGFSKQKAMDLLYWRKVKQSGLLFGSIMLLLFSLTQFSVVSVGAYLALAALSASISFRIYKSVLQAVQKTDDGHPFKSYLEVEISLSPDQIGKYVDKAQLYLNSSMKELRRLFLVQDLVDSIKFAVLMWLLTYVGALFNGLTLLILTVVSMFTMPVVYEKYQTQIDQYLGLVRTQVNSVVGKIKEKVPGAKRKEE